MDGWQWPAQSASAGHGFRSRSAIPKYLRSAMHNRIRWPIITGIILVAFLETAPAQNRPEAARPYPTYAADQTDLGPDRRPNQVPAQQIDPGIAPPTDAQRDPAAPQNPPPPPFTLTPQEQADLNLVLNAWEQQTARSRRSNAISIGCNTIPSFFQSRPTAAKNRDSTARGKSNTRRETKVCSAKRREKPGRSTRRRANLKTEARGPSSIGPATARTSTKSITSRKRSRRFPFRRSCRVRESRKVRCHSSSARRRPT